MSSNISIFNFKESQVRVQVVNNEPLFCLSDITTILNIKNANSTRFKLSNDGIHKMYSVDSLNRKNELTFIDEPNLYRVIFRSNKAEAVIFQNWVFEEVLPTIRKTGSYSKSQLALPLYDKDEITVNRTNLICLVSHMLWLSRFYREQRFYEIFQLLGSNYGVRMHDHFGDGAFVAGMFKRQIEKELNDSTLFNRYI